MANKNFLIHTSAEGEDSPLEYAAAIGWDPLKKQIRSWDFNSQGAHLEYVHVKTEKGWTMMRYDQSGFRLVLTENGREQGYVNLGNFFTEHCGQSREEQDAHIRNAVRACCANRKDLPDEFDDAKPDLLPTLRSRTYFELTKLQTQL